MGERKYKMILQRFDETDEEFEKRKRRVRLQSVSFDSFFAHGIGGSIQARSLANILYKVNNVFEYVIDASGNIYVDNKGSTRDSNDLLLNSGEPLAVLAGNEFDVGVATEYVSYYDVNAGWTFNATAPYTTESGKTYSQIFTHDTALDTQSQGFLENHIDLLAREALDGGTALNVTQSNITGYYQPKVEQGGYLQNIRTALGTELVTNGTFDADTDWTKGTGWTISAGVASSDGTQVADSLLTTSTVPTTVASTDYVVSFEVTAYTAGNVALQFDGTEVIADKAAIGTYSAIVTASDTTGTIDVVADLDFVGSVDNVTLKEVEALTIPNFSQATNYDNTDRNPKGHQTMHYEIDASGRVLSIKDNVLSFYGNSYSDTQWVPDFTKSFVIEIAHEFSGIEETKLNGISAGGLNEYVQLGQITNKGRPYFRVGSAGTGRAESVIYPQGVHLLALRFNGDTTTFDSWDDGNINVSGLSTTLPTGLTESAFLGCMNANGIPSSFNDASIDSARIIIGSDADNYDATEAYNAWLLTQP